MSITSCTPDEWYHKEEECLQTLQDENIWNQIPLLNVNELHNLKDATLVRFYGMIQDMHDPEFYLEKFEVKNLETQQISTRIGKYTDIVGCGDNENIDEDGAIKGERHTYVAISVPAVNPWVRQLEEQKFKCINNPTSSSSSQVKRPSEAMETDENTIEKTGNSASESNKRQRTNSAKLETPVVISQEHLLNFPIPDSNSKVCHIKMYKNWDSIKLNSVCEFVGFLSVDPTLATHDLDDEINAEEFHVHNPPPSLIPRIHCVSFKHLTHNNPLITQQTMNGNKMQYIRKELLILLTQLMLGDALAAEYLLYHLISEVYLRKDFMALGKFSVNISNIPKFENFDHVQELYKFFELLTTKSHYLGMSLENMNELTFIPKKDYTFNRLTSSILQLSANTHLILDETKLLPGKLNEAGVAGVKAIASAIKNQKATYDFTYYQIEFDCDIPFLIFSEGKSMLPSDIHVVLQPDDMHLNTFGEILEAARHFLKPELLNEIREYLTTARRTPYEISGAVEALVQNEFVNMRQKASDVSGDDLHNLLVLARLVCISQGKNTLDEECFRKACALEENRKTRLTTK